MRDIVFYYYERYVRDKCIDFNYMFLKENYGIWMKFGNVLLIILIG